jgi:hypothetical protein
MTLSVSRPRTGPIVETCASHAQQGELWLRGGGRVADGNDRTGADVFREVIVALSPRELPFLDSVVSSYRADPWTLEEDARLPADERVPWALFAMGFVAQSVVGGSAPGPGLVASMPAPPRARWWRTRSLPPRRHHLAMAPDLVLPAPDEPYLQRIRADAVRAAAVKGCSPADREAFAAAVIAALTVGRLPLSRRAGSGRTAGDT